MTSIVTLLADDGGLEERLDGLRLTRIRLKQGSSFGRVIRLRNLIQSQRPDLIHTTLFHANLIGRISARMVPTPVVTTLANQDYGPEHRSHSRYGSWGVRTAHAVNLISVPLTTRFHAISIDVAEVMSGRLRIPEDRIQVVYRGRDPARLGTYALERRLQTRAALSIGATTPVVLSVSRLDRQKGVETTIDAFRFLLRCTPEAVLIVAGRPGNAYPMIQAKAQACAAVRLLGHRTDIPDLMCAADVLSFPSRWEGLGGTLIEAMALRLPIVASDIPPVVEAIGDVGWPLVRPDDISSLARELISVLKDETANQAKRDAGESRFRKLFTAESAAEGMAGLYEDVLQSTTHRQ